MDFSALDRYIDSLTECGIPSTDVEVRKGHEVVYRHMSGFADAERTTPISGENLYWIWSCSKISLCMAGLKLVEEGKISLDDPVSKYLPEFERLFVRDGDLVRPAKTPLLVRHAFLMEGGWNYVDFSKLEHPERIVDNITLMQELVKMPLEFDPGTRYLYGLSQDILGAIVEKLTGESLGAYLKKSFFDPLGLTTTGFHPTDEQKKRFAARYEYNNETNIATPEPAFDGFAADLGSGGLFSSTADYSLILDALANSGEGASGARVLKPETVALCKENLLDDEPLQNFRRWQTVLYGYGWGLCGRVHMRPEVSLSPTPVGEFGWNGAAAAYGMADTQNRVSIFLTMHVHNCNYAYNVAHHRIRNLAYEAMGL